MQNFKYFMIPFLLGAVLWFCIFIFLPKTPTFFVTVSKDYSFYNINLAKLFFTQKNVIKHNAPTYSLKNIKLKAIYASGNKGFIVIEDKGKTHFVDLNEKYNGYKLVKINNKSAIFVKNGKKYKIEFKESELQGEVYKAQQQNVTPKYVKIKKSTFKEYKNDLFKVWKNIGIVKSPQGYKIVYVKPKSIFDTIGLKKGDIILEVNGRKLTNDQEAWDLYKNADKFKQFEIKLKRNNQIKVLYYEVD